MSDKPRPSQYLIEKSEALGKALGFFLKDTGIHHRSINEVLLVFLDQFTFWEWEISELIYTFDNFGERAKSWQADSLKSSIEQTLGILLRNNIDDGIEFNRYCRKYGVGPVVAPYEACNLVIDKWNLLLERCEERLLGSHKFVEQCKTQFNAQLEPDLKHFRKKHVGVA